LEHRVDAHHKTAAGFIPTGKVPANHFVGEREKKTVWTLRALEPTFVAQDPVPFISACRPVTGLIRLSAFETESVNVISSPKKAAKQDDLGPRRRMDV
jgi:hypothetical protein